MNVARSAVAAAAAALCLTLASCATVNRLNPADYPGSRLATQMPTPPVPRVNVAYDVTLDSHNPVFSALSVMTNLAKAKQAEKANEAMRQALESVDVPGIVLNESSAACADTLAATPAESRADADFLLVLDVRDWGIEADKPDSSVSLHMSLTASLYRSSDRDLVWQRRVSVDQPASPGMFGLGQIVGNMVTATTLYEMTADELSAGFREMARETARTVARLLARDLDRARQRR
jgi:ABC-type uncharacterized transport system auxiliary subunit